MSLLPDRDELVRRAAHARGLAVGTGLAGLLVACLSYDAVIPDDIGQFLVGGLERVVRLLDAKAAEAEDAKAALDRLAG